jgi:hypothetical protein
MATGDVRITRANGGWRVDLEGSTRAQWVFATQAEAWDAGRAMARRMNVEAVLYGRDGRIREVYGPGSRAVPR